MPTINSVGDIIPDAQLSSDQKKYIERLSKLKYPEDEKIIFHLHPKDFKTWLHLQNPKEALKLCSTFGISSKIQAQLNKTGWGMMKDFIWRLFH